MKFAEKIALLFFLLCVGSSFVRCQKVEKEVTHFLQHTDPLEWEETGGWMFATVSSRTNNLVYIARAGKHGIEISSLIWDENSRIDDPSKVQFTGCYFFLYCKKHFVIYLMQRAPCIDEKPPPKL